MISIDQNLTNVRYRLIPKFISGEIELSGIIFLLKNKIFLILFSISKIYLF